MFSHRFFCLLAAVLCIFSLSLTVGAAEVDCDATYCFSSADFSQDQSVSGICLTEVPGSGAVYLGSRILRCGDILTAEQVELMTYTPVFSEGDQTVQVSYLPIYDSSIGSESTMTIAIRGKEDKAPAAQDMAMETYKNLPNTAKLKVSDPEGQPMTFTVTRQPKRGTVTIAEDGTCTYTPKKNKVGIDSFVYTAADPSGNVSREATVTITILKPTDATQYTDTLGKECRFAAEWMKHSGIFVGENLADNSCFSPEKEVTRGEFVTMLVKALDIPVQEEVTFTGYTDDIPTWLQPYVAAALSSGLTEGLKDQKVFGAEEPITGTEVIHMLRNALDTQSVETFAQDSNSTVTRGEAAQMLYKTVKMIRSRDAGAMQ